MPTESYAKPASVEDARAFADTLYDYVIVGKYSDSRVVADDDTDRGIHL